MDAQTEKLKMLSIEYTWVINAFSQQKSKEISSSEFSPTNDPYNLKFNLALSPTKSNIELKICYKLSSYCFGTKMKLKCRVSIINSNKIKCPISDASCGNIYFNFISTKLMSRADLINPIKNYLASDTCTIHCEIFYSINLTSTGPNFIDGWLKISNSAIFKNYGDILKSGEFSDFDLVVGGKEFRVHKIVLAAQSPVFKAMFEHDTKEKREGRVEISDIDSEVMEYLLDYIYTGKVNLFDHCAIDLLVAADKYQIKHLKSVCIEVLEHTCSNLPEKNLRKIARLADMLNCTKLRDTALKKIEKKTIHKFEDDDTFWP